MGHGHTVQPDDLELHPLAEHDLPITERFLTSPEMMEHLGGAQSLETARTAHRRFVDTGKLGAGQMFKIVLKPESETAGTVGYWEKTWLDEPVYETGWNVFPPYQGRGVARAATRMLIERLKPVATRRFLHAYPSVSNAPSNGICRALGFEFLGEHQFEYEGHTLLCNDWRLDLTATSWTFGNVSDVEVETRAAGSPNSAGNRRWYE